jgi:hypothetical protein
MRLNKGPYPQPAYNDVSSLIMVKKNMWCIYRCRTRSVGVAASQKGTWRSAADSYWRCSTSGRIPSPCPSVSSFTAYPAWTRWRYVPVLSTVVLITLHNSGSLAGIVLFICSQSVALIVSSYNAYPAWTRWSMYVMAGLLKFIFNPLMLLLCRVTRDLNLLSCFDSAVNSPGSGLFKVVF